MARGRMINKVISLDEKVNALSDDTARLLFTWMIPHLDCEGRMHGDATTVKSIVFPRRNISAKKTEKYLKELEEFELIFRYSVNGNQYIWIKNFERHQRGLRKEKEAPSQIPPFAPNLGRSEDGVGQTQTKIKEEIKAESKEECSISSSLIEDVFASYKTNIGRLTTDIENEIDLAVKKFTAGTVLEAIREAVLHNKPNWAYVRGILNNWENYGKSVGFSEKGTPDRYVKGKYGHLVQR